MFEIIGGNTWDIYYTVIGNEQSSEYFEASAMAVQSRTRLAASLGERETGCHGNIPQSGRTWEHGTGGVPRVPMQGAGVSNTTGLKDPVHNYNLGFLSKGQKGIILSTSGLGKKIHHFAGGQGSTSKNGVWHRIWVCFQPLPACHRSQQRIHDPVRRWHPMALCVGDEADFAVVASSVITLLTGQATSVT